ncbi:MAG TPA: type II toxin-antitoxin system VapC family toxin [Candidatus Binatia bacterium]
MILLDTHAWVWWVHGDARLSEEQRQMLDDRTVEGLGVSIISCWEVAKLVEYGRLKLPHDVAEWLGIALGYPGVRLLDLTAAIVVESTRLPQPFHRNPADQLIVATGRIHDYPIATADDKILNYAHVRTVNID